MKLIYRLVVIKVSLRNLYKIKNIELNVSKFGTVLKGPMNFIISNSSSICSRSSSTKFHHKRDVC